MLCIKTFKDISKADVALAGGKGASLGEMTSAGIPIPPGFVILAQAFDEFIEETGVKADIDAVLHKVDHKEVHTVEEASEEIQAMILSQKMPEAIAVEIKNAFKKLNSTFVAVRSSATSEDSSTAAWAGQLDTYLNTTKDKLLENVKKCWASLFTPRAIFYRFEKGLHGEGISVAVVVQKMVDSECSGIAFSVHPVTQDPNQLIIESGFGLGEAIVSGQITPDSYIVEKNKLRITEVTVNVQDKALYRNPKGGNIWKDLSESQGKKQVLNQKEIIELSKLVIQIEKHYNFPVDIEWAREKEKFYIVQSRPITTLVKESEETKAPGEKETDKKGFRSPELKNFNPEDWNFHGRWQIELFAACFWTSCFNPKILSSLGINISGRVLFYLTGGYSFRYKPQLDRISVQIYEKIKRKDTAFLDKLVDYAKKTFTNAIKFAEKYKDKEITEKSFWEFLEIGKDLHLYWAITAVHLAGIVEKILQEQIVKESLPSEYVPYLIPKIVTPLFERQQELKLLKKKIGDRSLIEIRKNKKLLNEFEKHRQKYAWIEIFSWIGDELSQERLFYQIKDFKSLEEKTPNIKVSTNLKYLVECMKKVGYVKQAGAEYTSIYEYMMRPYLYRLAGFLGISYREMVRASHEEIAKAIRNPDERKKLKKIVKSKNQRKWALFGSTDCKESVLFDESDVSALEKQMIPRYDKNVKEIKGEVGNKGFAKGPVRIVMNVDDFHKMKSGEVLVTTMTTPDFAILMQKSSAIVTDIGGMLCHAAIFSREMKKPCVIGTKIATRLLKDGDYVEVDAGKGIVKILKQAEHEPKRLEPKEYEYLWSNYDINFITTSCRFFSKHFKETDIVLVYDWKQRELKFFLSKKDSERIAKECVTFYQNDFNSWKKSILADMRKTEQLVNETKKYCTQMSKMPFEDIRLHFLERVRLFQSFWNSYFYYTNFFSVAKAEKLILKEPQKYKLLKKNLEEMSRIKFNARGVLNKFLMYNETFRPYVEEIGKRLRRDDIAWLSAEEICDLMSGKDVPYSDRNKAYWVLARRFEWKLISGEEAKKISDDFDSFHFRPPTGVIKGVTANPGIYKGTVKILEIIFSDNITEAIHKVRKGDVLVGSTTGPEVMAACQRAGAIVTNEGGLTSHAAIVSRELGIPCIVGTKIGSKVLKDGDYVEVDANKGVVKILRKAGEAKAEAGHKPNFQKLLSRKHATLTDDILIHAWNDEKRFSSLTGIQEYVKNLEIIDGDFYFDLNWMEEITRKYSDKDLKIFRTFIKEGYSHGERLKSFVRGLNNRINIQDAFWESVELLKNLLVFLPETHPLAKAIEMHVADILKTKGVGEGKLMKTLLEVSAPEKLNGSSLEIKELKEIQEKASKDKKFNLDKALKEHTDKYAYLGYREPFSQGYNKEFFRKRLEKLKSEESVPKKHKLSFNKSEREYIDLLREFVYFRNYRTEKLYEALYYLEQVWRKLSVKYGLGEKDIGYYLLEEIGKLLNESKKVKDSKISERILGYAMLLHNDQIELITGEALRDKKDSLNKVDSTIKEIKGSAAYRGKASGNVRIVLKASEQNKVSEGDILVTTMTTPDFLPAMQKAIAFVTDEGGVTCHAAIIAREMKKPCIIGTKIATQVLKDGDLVEVDTNKGIVRKIK